MSDLCLSSWFRLVGQLTEEGETTASGKVWSSPKPAVDGIQGMAYKIGKASSSMITGPSVNFSSGIESYDRSMFIVFEYNKIRRRE